MRFLRLVGGRSREESGSAAAPSAPRSERLTVAEAARRLGVSESTVRRRVAAGDLRHLRERAGGRSRIWVVLEVEAAGTTSRPDGARWAVRHRHTLGWLAGGAGAPFAAALDRAQLFDSAEAAERAGRDSGAPIDVVAVYRPEAASA